MEHTYFNRELETAGPDAQHAREFEHLRRLLGEVFISNPFYQKKLREAGFTAAEDLHSLDDLAALPLTTKQELVKDQNDHPLFGTNLTFPSERYIHLHQTSGTTGGPLRWLDTVESWAWWGRCWATIYRAASVGPGDRIDFPISFGPFIGFWAGWAGSQEVGAMAISGGGQNSEQRLKSIIDLRAIVVCFTPSYALHLAEVARQLDLDLQSATVRAIVVAGEPGGSIPGTKQRIEADWNARVFDHTGATEVGAHGFTCRSQCGVHLNEAEFIAEVIDPITAKSSEMGELIITNLGRVGMPVIRYRTDDVVRLNHAPCECGRTFARMDGGILGRADDMLTVRGVNIFPSAVENIVRQHDNVIEFAAEVHNVEELDEMEICIEVADGNAARIAENLAHDLQQSLGLRLRVTPVPAGQLPRYELKARLFRDRR